MPASILVVGDVITDIVVRLREPIVWGTDTRSAIEIRAGGSAANVAAWLGDAGARVRFVGRVGDDVFAAFHRSELGRVGVEAALRIDDSYPTGSIVVLVSTDGERTMLTDRGANLQLQAEDLPVDAFRSHDALYITGYSFFEAGVRETAHAAIASARRAGMSVAVDPSSDPLLAEVGTDEFFSWTEGADFLFPNMAEARALTGRVKPEEMALDLAGRYGEVILTCGPQGALWCSEGQEVISIPARTVSVVDTTGAGDAFAAGFLAARMPGCEPREALVAGSVLAGRVVSQIGARP